MRRLGDAAADVVADLLLGPLPCPIVPPCEHPMVLHDRYSDDDPRYICCADGCSCRMNPEPDPADQPKEA